MSGNINRSEIARKARMKGLKNLSKRFKREAKELLKTNPNMSIDEAIGMSKDAYYQKSTAKMLATRKANAATTKTLLDFSENVGKQAVYAALLAFAETLNEGKGKLTALTMPGANNEFERKLGVAKLFMIERDATRRKIIEENFSDWIKAEVGHVVNGDFPFVQSKTKGLWDEFSPRLNFVWFDFMGAYLKKYSAEFNRLFANSTQTKMVFAVTIGSRGRKSLSIPLDEVEGELERLFKLNGWKQEGFTACSYKSENGTKMTTIIYSISRAETEQDKKRKEIKAKIHQLQYELFQLEDKSTPTTPKKTRKKYNISPEAATERANKAWATRRANAKKAAK